MQVPAKILLFGEHIVLQGASALALPWHHFGGTWALAEPSQIVAKQQKLPELLAHLEQQEVERLLKLDQLAIDLAAGLYFNSNIPTGYGAGSSGALCAAIFHRYLRIGLKLNLPELKAALGQIESFFHGSSSGTDPLISYLNLPVLLKGGGAIETIQLPKAPAHFFVIDTGIERQTGPWVATFLQKSQGKNFQTTLQTELIPASDQAIQALINHEPDLLWTSMEVISRFHLEYIPEFIPAAFHELWQKGLSSDTFKLKICGAGGGGYILGMAKSIEVVESLKSDYTIHLVEW